LSGPPQQSIQDDRIRVSDAVHEKLPLYTTKCSSGDTEAQTTQGQGQASEADEGEDEHLSAAISSVLHSIRTMLPDSQASIDPEARGSQKGTQRLNKEGIDVAAKKPKRDERLRYSEMQGSNRSGRYQPTQSVRNSCEGKEDKR